MGVDYGITIGYGFAMSEGALPDIFIEDDYTMDSWDITTWLRENGYEFITCIEVGNLMDGNTMYLFCLKDSCVNEDIYEFDGMYDLSVEPVEGKIDLLRQLAHELGHEGSIGWKVSGNVS